MLRAAERSSSKGCSHTDGLAEPIGGDHAAQIVFEQKVMAVVSLDFGANC